MKMPPKAKIYEAFSAIVDNRVELYDQEVTVSSSNFEKQYTVKWKENKYTSNDNASFWQGYPGYPIICIWILKGILPKNEKIMQHFKNINWHEKNKQNKRDYDKVVNEILNELVVKGVDTEEIEAFVDSVYDKIQTLNFNVVKKI